MKTLMQPICPLCQAAPATLFYRDRRRDYFHCRSCGLVFVPPAYFLSKEAEKAEYDLHRNKPEDQGYRRFLSRIFRPLQEILSTGSQGLDFGSGPGPTLSVMLEEAGYCMTIYDPFYAPTPLVFEKRYDFITATEVVEHLHNPRMELDRLWRCIKPGGILGIMTKMVLGPEEFARWHYKNDLTHVCFFARTTFRWLAGKWRAELLFAADDVILIGKQPFRPGLSSL